MCLCPVWCMLAHLELWSSDFVPDISNWTRSIQVHACAWKLSHRSFGANFHLYMFLFNPACMVQNQMLGWDDPWCELQSRHTVMEKLCIGSQAGNGKFSTMQWCKNYFFHCPCTLYEHNLQELVFIICSFSSFVIISVVFWLVFSYVVIIMMVGLRLLVANGKNQL
jgi:hypothetical protein